MTSADTVVAWDDNANSDITYAAARAGPGGAVTWLALYLSQRPGAARQAFIIFSGLAVVIAKG